MKHIHMYALARYVLGNKLKYKLILEKEISNHDDGDLLINLKNLEKEIKTLI